MTLDHEYVLNFATSILQNAMRSSGTMVVDGEDDADEPMFLDGSTPEQQKWEG